MLQYFYFLHSVPSNGKEVFLMDGAISFILSVVASVVGYYVCKWFDEKLGKK